MVDAFHDDFLAIIGSRKTGVNPRLKIKKLRLGPKVWNHITGKRSYAGNIQKIELVGKILRVKTRSQ